MPESQDKDIHAEFHRTQRWRDRLFKGLCHKSLDIPEDDVNINQHGITGKHLVWLAGIILTGLLGWRALTPNVPQKEESTLPVPAVQEYEVRFWLEDGTELEVQPFMAKEPK